MNPGFASISGIAFASALALTTGCGSRPFAPSPLRAGFPLYATLPGDQPGAGQIIRVTLGDDDLPQSEVYLAGLDFPSGLAVDPSGTLFFTENRGNYAGRVRRFTPEATEPEDVVTGLDKPTRLALDSFGRLHVSTSEGVLSIDASGEPHAITDASAATDAMAFDETDNLYLLGGDTQSQVVRLSPRGDESDVDDGLGDAGLVAPIGLAVGTAATLYVVDQGAGRTDGRLLRVSEAHGVEELVVGLVNPVAVALEDQSVPFIAESTPAFRIVRFVETLSATVRVAALEGIPHSLAFTPRHERGNLASDPGAVTAPP